MYIRLSLRQLFKHIKSDQYIEALIVFYGYFIITSSAYTPWIYPHLFQLSEVCVFQFVPVAQRSDLVMFKLVPERTLLHTMQDPELIKMPQPIYHFRTIIENRKIEHPSHYEKRKVGRADFFVFYCQLLHIHMQLMASPAK